MHGPRCVRSCVLLHGHAATLSRYLLTGMCPSSVITDRLPLLMLTQLAPDASNPVKHAVFISETTASFVLLNCRCHFGLCPPCPHPCGQMLGCGHRCAAEQCHDPQPPDIPQFEQPAPPKQSALESLLAAEHPPASSAQVGPAAGWKVVGSVLVSWCSVLGG